MAVGKGSMARASKAVKKTAEPVLETKVEVVEEVKVVKEVKKEKKPVAKKRVEKKVETVCDMVAIGDEMPVFYL